MLCSEVGSELLGSGQNNWGPVGFSGSEQAQSIQLQVWTKAQIQDLPGPPEQQDLRVKGDCG